VLPFVRIVLINFDGGSVTLRCLEALHKTKWDVQRLEIVLVDNASVDGLDWKIPGLYPDVRIINSLTNEGFARGNNLALSDLDEVDVVALINNDTIPDPEWLSELVDTLYSEPKIGGVGAKLLFNKLVVGVELDPDGQLVCLTNVRINGKDSLHLLHFDERFDRSGIGAGSPTQQHWFSQPCSFWIEENESLGEQPEIEIELFSGQQVTIKIKTDLEVIEANVGISPSRVCVSSTNKARVINNAGEGIFPGLHGGDIGFKELDLGHRDQTCEVFGFCGGAVAFRSEFLKDVGIFDPTFFLYYEDIDLAWRGRLRGWKFYYTSKSVVFHEHSYSSKEGSPFVRFWSDRNRRLTLIKNGTAKMAVKAIVGSILWAIRDSLIVPFRQLLHGKKPNIQASLYRARQLGSFLKAIPDALRSRKTINKSRVLPRSFIFEWIQER
jgi:hypothetical protein